MRPQQKFKALYQFDATNNDELPLLPGEVIVLTRAVDGGWWEGTNESGKVGWFPTNYVEECQADRDSNSSDQESHIIQGTDMLENRKMALHALETFISDHVEELENSLVVVFRRLRKVKSFPTLPLSMMSDSLNEYLASVTNLLNAFKSAGLSGNQDSKQFAAGYVFMEYSSSIRSTLERYSSLHPAMLQIFSKHRTVLSNATTTAPYQQTNYENALLSITRQMASPFRFVDKLAALLKDLEYTYENSYPDKGDLQRACRIYAFIAASCEKSRKRKELEVEILSRNVVGYEGNLASSFGVPLAITNATLQVDTHGVQTDTKERILILYPSFLLTFSYSSEKDQYKFEGKLSLSSLQLNEAPQHLVSNYNRQNIAKETQENKRVLELTGSLMQRIMITFPTTIEYQNWYELLSRSLSRKQSPVRLNSSWAFEGSDHNDSSDMFPSLPPTSGDITIEKDGIGPTAAGMAGVVIGHTRWISSCPRRCIRPHCTQKQIPDDARTVGSSVGGGIAAAALIDGNRSFRRGLKSTRKMKSHGSVDVLKRFETCETDALLLSVIESYQKSSSVTRQAQGNQGRHHHEVDSVVSSSDLNGIMFATTREPMATSAKPSNERNIVLAVAHINQQMKELQAALRNLKRDLSEEKRARLKLERDLESDQRATVDMRKIRTT